MIIFGTTTMNTKVAGDDILAQSCPQCNNDLILYNLKNWFTLYFIPIFPFKILETYYKCSSCEGSYKQDIKDMLKKQGKKKADVEKEVKKAVALTLATCMTHMAKIDGSISKEESKELKELSIAFPTYKKDIEETIERVKKSKDDKEVFATLIKISKVLTIEGIAVIIGKIAHMLLADGNIAKKEEVLMKEYLLVCGIPKQMYEQIIEKVRSSA